MMKISSNITLSGCCDLHTHSTYSDGTYTPRQIIEEANRLLLSAVALTDHNTTAGLDEFLTEANARGVTAIAGVELSTLYCGKELHLLGLYISESQFDKITDLMNDVNKRKEQMN